MGEGSSCVFDLGSSISLNPHAVKLVGWFDNDWPYCVRLVELIRFLRCPATLATSSAPATIMSLADTAGDFLQDQSSSVLTLHPASLSSSIAVCSRSSSRSMPLDSESPATGALASRRNRHSLISNLDSVLPDFEY